LEAGKEALELSEEATQAAQKETTAAITEKEKLAAALTKAEHIAAHYKKVPCGCHRMQVFLLTSASVQPLAVSLE